MVIYENSNFLTLTNPYLFYFKKLHNTNKYVIAQFTDTYAQYILVKFQVTLIFPYEYCIQTMLILSDVKNYVNLN